MTSPQTEVREKLAELEHRQWLHWEQYREYKKQNTGIKEWVKQEQNWFKLRNTDYQKLTEVEKK